MITDVKPPSKMDKANWDCSDSRVVSQLGDVKWRALFWLGVGEDRAVGEDKVLLEWSLTRLRDSSEPDVTFVTENINGDNTGS